MKMFTLVLSLLLIVSLAGCGGGGSTVTGTSGTAGPGTIQVTGTAAHGLIRNGTVKVYLLSGSSRVLLASTTTNDNGKYTAVISPQSGPVLVEVTGGTYTDEATGGEVPNPAPLRAAVPSATTPIVTVAVTTVTEIAFQVAESAPTAAAISTANAKVSDLFNVNIIATEPVAPTSAAFNQNATADQQAYTLALAGLSQQAKDTPNGTITSIMSAYRNEIASAGTLTPQTATLFKSGVTAFLSSARNLTGATVIPTQLASIGTVTIPVTLSIGGSFASGSFINGVHLKLKLPSGVTVQRDAGGQLTSGAITAVGSAAVGSTITPNYDPQTNILGLGIMNAPGFGLGNFVTIVCDVAPNAALNVANFVITEQTVVDAEGKSINVTIAVSL